MIPFWLPQVTAVRVSAWVESQAGAGSEAPVDCIAVRDPATGKERYLDAQAGDKWYIRLEEIPVRTRRVWVGQ